VSVRGRYGQFAAGPQIIMALPVSGTQQPDVQSAADEQSLMHVDGTAPNAAHVVPSQQRTASVPHAVS